MYNTQKIKADKTQNACIFLILKKINFTNTKIKRRETQSKHKSKQNIRKNGEEVQ